MVLPRFRGSSRNENWDSGSNSGKEVAVGVDSQDTSSDLDTSNGKIAGQPERKGSTLGAFLNIVCVIIGTGSLQLPLTFQQSGWIGIILVIISGVIGTLTGSLVIKSLYLMSGNRVRNFNQIGHAAFGIVGRLAIYFFHTIYVVGIVGDYIILAGQSFNQIAKDGGHDIGENAWKVICAAIMWLACISLKQMSEAAVLSFLGFSTSMVTLLIAIIQSFMHPYRSDGSVPIEHHAARHDAAVGSGVPIALASISFSFCAVVVMPSVESSMKNPKMWNRVLGSAMTVVTCTYLFIAIVGYWAFGDQVMSPVLENLPQNAATKAAKILISLHVIFASPVMATSLALELELAMNITKERLGKVKEFVFRALFRTLFFAAMTGVAIGIPYFGDIIALVGSFSTSILLFIVPTVCYVKLRGWRNIKWYFWIISVAVVGLGFYVCVLGAKGAIESLQQHIRENK
ncbi:hypothetical protein GQ54DRAFT_299356 [Martensiomyces pterosporus]|nr:hypothetical protein GQ54DRAFT_299356 [Martensiomyces pterosporus]